MAAMSLEEKAYRALKNAMMDRRFHPHRVARMMAEDDELTNAELYELIRLYAEFMEIRARYGHDDPTTLKMARVFRLMRSLDTEQ